MLIPRVVSGQLVLADSGQEDIEKKIQFGCGDCGWSGDIYLSIRRMPKKYGEGWAVILQHPGDPATIILRSDLHQPLDPMTIDHRVIEMLAESRKNWEQKELLADMMEKHDAKVDHDNAATQKEMTDEISRQYRHVLKKEGKI